MRSIEPPSSHSRICPTCTWTAGIPQCCRCSLDDTPILSHGWAIPPPDWDLIDAPLPAAESHFDGCLLVSQLAERLWGPDKRIDLFIVQASNSGKTSFAEACEMALPGAITRTDASEFTAASAAFSEHSESLAHSLVSFLDEVSKCELTWTDVVYGMTDSRVRINTKHHKVIRLPRIGAAVLVADVTPTIDSTAQGMVNRLGVSWRPDLQPYSLSEDGRAHWLSPEQIDRPEGAIT